MWFNDIATIDLTYCQATKAKKKTLLQNYREFWQWLAYFSELGINRYKITGDYPDSLDERTILQSLFWYGSFCLFNDNGVWLSLPGLPASDLTVYGYPTKINVFGRNGYNKTIGLIQYAGEEKQVTKGISDVPVLDKKGFWVQEKKFMYPLANSALITAERVADAMRSIDVMRVLLKSPFVVFCIEEMRRTVEEYFKNIKDNDDLIISTGVFDPSKVQVSALEFNPENVKVMRELVEWYLAQYLNFCGVNSNPASDKQERLLVDEINANDEETDNNVKPEIEFMNNQLDIINDFTGWSMKMEVNYNDKDIQGNSGYLLGKSDLSDDGDGSGQREN